MAGGRLIVTDATNNLVFTDSWRNIQSSRRTPRRR